MSQRTRLVGLALAIVLTAGLIRAPHLTRWDLYADEALAAEISRSLLHDGELNNFRFSRFTPATQFRDGVWVYYPPGFYLMQAPFFALDNLVHPSLVPRLPVFIGGLLLLLLLPVASRHLLGSTWPGWAAALLSVPLLPHITLSVTALPYDLLPLAFTIAVATTARALATDRPAHWTTATAAMVGGFSLQQIGLVTVVLLMAVGMLRVLQGRHDRVRRLALSAATVMSAAAVWMMVSLGSATPFHNAATVAPDYRFIDQVSMVLERWSWLLPGIPLKLAAGVGLVALIARGGSGRRRERAVLLVGWACSPLAFVLSRSLWIGERHMLYAFPALILMAAYGVWTVIRFVLSRGSRRRTWTGRASGTLVASATAYGLSHLVVAGAPFEGSAGSEFGSPNIVSRAAAHIRDHGRGELVIAPVGLGESYYLDHFVRDRRVPDPETELQLIATAPAWVFTGDNFLRRGSLDAFDRSVRDRGTLVMRSRPVPAVTAPDNPIGYALHYVEPTGRTPAPSATTSSASQRP